MAVRKLKWSSLLHLTELEFEPESPKVLEITDELIQSLSWLTAATKHDRRLLRCDENGALLIADPWSLLNSVEAEDLYPASDSPKTFTATKPNKGILIATSTQIILVDFYQVGDTEYDRIFISPDTMYWYPHKTAKVIIATVPYTGGTTSSVGVTAFN
ncbi:unnamed protein product [marine sediment metagenome]|uniref:Uncharacterized protein n=1 Tax=marine sediment metagenome TaxID=412755 RepID=X1BSA4_9ZZZZ